VEACFAEINVAKSTHTSAPWYLDSGASYHVSRDFAIFSSLEASSGTKIISTGGHAHNVTDVGSVAIWLPTGEIQKITNVLYSCGITKNLFYIRFLAEKGFSLEFQTLVCYIHNPTGKTIAIVKHSPRNGLYQLCGETITHYSEVLSCTTNHSSLIMKWHKWLGHFHIQGIRRMVQAGAITGLPKMNLSNVTCETCLQSKQSRKAVPKVRTTLNTQVLELVHTDVCNPFRVKSLGGTRYFISFIDDFSRTTFVYFMYSKNEAFDKFRLFHQEVEK
jgi:hypothetical protein